MRINILCLLCLLFSACNNENIIEPSSGSGDECVFQFMLKVPGTIEVETKSVETKGTKEILKLGETSVYNVWILQFNSEGTGLLKAVFANQEDIHSVGTGNTYDQLLIQLVKESMRFRNEDSVFYIIVNGESSSATEETANLFVDTGGIPTTLTVSDLMAKTKEITYSGDGSATGANILSSGPTAYKKDDTINTEMKLVILSRMYRAFAKVTVEVESSINPTVGKFNLINTNPVIIANVPNRTRLYDDGSSSYPTSDATNFQSSGIPVSGIVLGEKEGTFYLAENIRGTGTATSAQEKNIGSKGPGGTLDGCTYLLVKGQFRYYLGQQSGESKYSDPIDVEYKFYLGGDLVTDYNIYRDYHYKIKINIAGPNSADYRVKITDGNVAVFDNVTTITNTVTF